ncbi:hypothetical protein DFH28DRAFT_1179449 [Melampsora americana]|nr:hypothetical protein DFH28DRAFT_1179449 [Melampsora americana]
MAAMNKLSQTKPTYKLTQREDLGSDTEPVTPTHPRTTAQKRQPNTPLQNERRALPIQAEIVKLISVARDAVQKASILAENEEEKRRLCDLVQILREYSETEKINAPDILTKNAETYTKGVAILTTQIACLERAVQKIERQTNPSNQSWAQVASQNQSMESAASQNFPSLTPPDIPSSSPGLSTLGSNSHPSAQYTQNTSSNLDTQRRIVLHVERIPKQSILELRNSLNKALGKPIIAAVNTTAKGNITLTTSPNLTAQDLLNQQSTIQKIIPFNTAKIDEPWYKVAIHGIPIAEYNEEGGLDYIKEEIHTFNQGLQVQGQPIWLTSAEKRQTAFSGSVLVAFATKEEATHAIRNRLYIAGRSLKVEEGRPRKNTDDRTQKGRNWSPEKAENQEPRNLNIPQTNHARKDQNTPQHTTNLQPNKSQNTRNSVEDIETDEEEDDIDEIVVKGHTTKSKQTKC